MIRINQLKLPPNHSEEDMTGAIRKKLKLKNEEFTYSIEKRSMDGRKKPYVQYVYSVDVAVKEYQKQDELRLIKKRNDSNIMQAEPVHYEFPKISEAASGKSIVIIGSGPAGLFCGYMLAKAGLKPLILERGSSVDIRKEKVFAFWKDGVLDTECNVQFGEGGAGTFSDGKLNTQVKDASGRIRKVLEIFVEHGAPEEILYSAKPHIGTDILIDVVKNIRNSIIELGGIIRFDSKMTDICLSQESNSKYPEVEAIMVNDTERISCDLLILAPGHSARDTFEMLYEKGMQMIPKAFAVGVRMEHPQQMIDEYAYGENIYELPAASYKVTHRAEGGRGVYSFCMCPGGYVVNASSEKERLCINGMSNSKRDGENANSAIVVTVNPSDYGDDSPLCGVEFQRRLEEAAFAAGKGKIPCQTYGSFRKNQKDEQFGKIQPSAKGAVAFANLHEILPDDICSTIVEGVEGFARQIPDFDRDDAVLSAVESRTSSPLRMIRNENMISNITGLLPCGEGAGYAGGITSAAVDGIRAAEMTACGRAFLCAAPDWIGNNEGV